MGKRTDGYALWDRAVHRGGIGHTAAAFALLDGADRVGRERGDDVLSSLASSTRASLLRQAGRHRQAATYDGRALLLVGVGSPDGGQRRMAAGGRWRQAALLDALVGLAADHLGRLRLSDAARLLDRARDHADPDDGGWLAGRRPRLRIEWVSAELAMYGGDAAKAVGHAEAGCRLAELGDTPERHRVKTTLIAAAAAATAGDSRHAAELAGEVTRRAADAGLMPLQWASLALRNGLDAGDEQVTKELARTRSELISRGVPFDNA
ncbi:hypothetical protein [Gordonia sp. SL306]|uniref:hypothetical protein n=1 Tax=Gordonia sp. SL306 TaxID=2995145 RepID=UPI00226F1C98|nr:hypothetical protein [Gordonia sp. SL306]WAC54732.1 hypothetical protein OVA31_19065 [Gordonia sp. SL306]